MPKGKLTELFELLSGLNSSDVVVRLHAPHAHAGEHHIHRDHWRSLLAAVQGAARRGEASFTWPPVI